MGLIEDALHKAEQAVVHRPIPATTYGQTAYLLHQAEIADRRAIRGTDRKPAGRAELARRVGEQVGVSQRTVERWRDKQIKHAGPAHAASLAAAVRTTWQPKVRARAVKKAATETGITIETRARFGFTAAPGTTDDGRMRRITQHLPAAYAQQIFDAKAAGATEQQLKDILAGGLQEQYFKDQGRRAAGLLVEFTDIDYMELDY